MNFRNQRNNLEGFTLVEALVALSILIVGIISGFILVTKALYSTAVIQDRLTASFLAQEGIELVRQIRDSNFLKILAGEDVQWDSGLNDGYYIISADINPPAKIQLQVLEGTKVLKYNADSGLYNYNPEGQDTFFERTISIRHISADELIVQSIMNWKSKNIKFNFITEDHLFNWMKL